jgi:sulfate/thiosulfate transport system permease protein
MPRPADDRPARAAAATAHLTEPRPVRWLLTAIALGFLGLFLFLPLALVFLRAFGDGLGAYAAAIRDPVTLSSVRLTLLTTALVLPANIVFGVAAAWVIARFRFRGRNVLVTLLDVPFSVSPVISGLVFVLLFGAQGAFGPVLRDHGIRIIFAWPGIVLATLFVTSPFVARELIPVLEAQGTAEEEASLTLGAGGWTTFVRVTLPKIRWGLLYGIVLCTARAMGEFGAVSVVSGHIRGRTTTIPLHVEMLYNEYQFTAAFAVASLLSLLALVTLVAKYVIERKGMGKAGSCVR